MDDVIQTFTKTLAPYVSLNFLKDFTQSLYMPRIRGARLQRFEIETAEKPLGNQQIPIYAMEKLPTLPDELTTWLQNQVPWCKDGFYLPEEVKIGQTLVHQTGCFYVQEPSAMGVVEVLQPKPGEWILDLCAAPGGKSTAIGKKLHGSGWLVANEIHPERVTVLAENLERCGVQATVTQSDPSILAAAWPEIFDAILVDAPCSGEGMFRKSAEARQEWNPELPAKCAERQKNILHEAVKLLKPGGRLVYSTCTLNPIENEWMIDWLLKHFPLRLLPINNLPNWSLGLDIPGIHPDIVKHVRRCWPHLLAGEGHFVALLEKVAPSQTTSFNHSIKKSPQREKTKSSPKDSTHLWLDFLNETWQASIPDEWRLPIQQGNVLFSQSPLPKPLVPVKTLRPGLALAHLREGKLIPHQALASGAHPSAFAKSLDLPGQEALAYLRGEAMAISTNQRGYLLLTWLDAVPLGFAKAVPGRLNNLYPKGLRRVLNS